MAKKAVTRGRRAVMKNGEIVEVDDVELFDLLGDGKLTAGPYQLEKINGDVGVWRCRHCRAGYFATIPLKPATTHCLKCGRA